MMPVQLYQEWIAFWKNNQLACPIKSWTGFSCPGCGMQRSALAWLEGHWIESWHTHPGVWFGILLLAIVASRNVSPLAWRKTLVVSSFIGYMLVMLIRYLYLVVNQ